MMTAHITGNRIFVLALLLLFCCASTGKAVSYYIDSAGGNDTYSGTSSSTPWQTLSKVNSTIFAAGDRLLFKAGGSWTGQLNPKGSGSSGNPIIIDMYGTGGKPIIDAAGAIGNGAFYLYNQQYWDVNSLELTNNAATGADRRGVHITASNYGTVNHIYLRNLYIHNIKGIIGQDETAKRTGGIIIETISDATVDTRFNDILIEGCTIQTADNQGIATTNAISVIDYPGSLNWEKRKVTNLRIRNNAITDISKNAMIIRLTDETCVVEYNVCWDTAYRTGSGNTIFSRSSRGTVFQYNEGYLNRSTLGYDGCLYDADLQSPACIFQYSYSHDNNHGLFWQCTVVDDADVIVRYNISQNDKGSIFCMNYDNTSTYVYNNTVYIPSNLSPKIIDERRAATVSKTYYFYNNIIINLSPTATYNWYNGNRTFDYNVFYGYHPTSEPSDPHKLTSDPMLVSPGSGGYGLNTLTGYQLQPDSPCIDSGMAIANNGGKDFWGNPVPYNTLTDRGANEYQGTAPLPGAATNPTPANNASSIEFDAGLSWTAGYGAISHDVYFGTNPTPDAGEFVLNTTQPNFNPGLLEYYTTYYWRIDEKNETGTTPGTVWHFTTEKSIADFDSDGDVDFADLAVLTSEWLASGNGNYVEESGLVVMEAEHYSAKIAGSGIAAGSNWTDLIGEGSIGDGFVQALPNSGVALNDPNTEPYSPKLSYLINFQTTGKYYVWLKGWGLEGSSDSVHYGLDGSVISTDINNSLKLYNNLSYFAWRSETGLGRPAIQINSAGVHSFDLWMREDGAKVDRILLTTSSSYTPAEPAESGSLQADFDGSGTVNFVDLAIFAEDWTGDI